MKTLILFFLPVFYAPRGREIPNKVKTTVQATKKPPFNQWMAEIHKQVINH